MSRHLRSLLAVALAAGVAAAPSSVWAEKGAKTEAASAKKTQASSSDFEENRKLHTQKSKENNEKKGAE